jgi:hypothetical protein
VQAILKKLVYKGQGPVLALKALSEAAALTKGADLNRDPGHLKLASLGWDGVTSVALDDNGSAMRFKHV